MQIQAESRILTVGATPRQRLEGLGCSLVNTGNNRALKTSERLALSGSLFTELGMNTLRLWFSQDRGDPATLLPEQAAFDSFNTN